MRKQNKSLKSVLQRYVADKQAAEPAYAWRAIKAHIAESEVAFAIWRTRKVKSVEVPFEVV